jgi:protoporphyrinogen oxidase
MRHVSTLIVGAGPTGLGAATKFHEFDEKDWLLVESNSVPGGLARTLEWNPSGTCCWQRAMR